MDVARENIDTQKHEVWNSLELHQKERERESDYLEWEWGDGL
jgi:hypothetical protein